MLTSTTRSLFPIKSGIAIACTGVVRAKPLLCAKSSIHEESSGVKASKDFGFFSTAASCAMIVDSGVGKPCMKQGIIAMEAICAFTSQKMLELVKVRGPSCGHRAGPSACPAYVSRRSDEHPLHYTYTRGFIPERDEIESL